MEAIRGVFAKNSFLGYIAIDDDGQQTEAKQTHPLESLNVYEYLKINFSTFQQVNKAQDGKKREFAQMASLDKKTTLTTVLQTAVS